MVSHACFVTRARRDRKELKRARELAISHAIGDRHSADAAVRFHGQRDRVAIDRRARARTRRRSPNLQTLTRPRGRLAALCASVRGHSGEDKTAHRGLACRPLLEASQPVRVEQTVGLGEEKHIAGKRAR
eukprot:4511836-Pleurochrysis_carterae.AAC.2